MILHTQVNGNGENMESTSNGLIAQLITHRSEMSVELTPANTQEGGLSENQIGMIIGWITLFVSLINCAYQLRTLPPLAELTYREQQKLNLTIKFVFCSSMVLICSFFDHSSLLS